MDANIEEDLKSKSDLDDEDVDVTEVEPEVNDDERKGSEDLANEGDDGDADGVQVVSRPVVRPEDIDLDFEIGDNVEEFGKEDFNIGDDEDISFYNRMSTC